MPCESLTEHKAQLIVEGCQRDELDHLDLLAIITDFDRWTEESESAVARECRGEDEPEARMCVGCFHDMPTDRPERPDDHARGCPTGQNGAPRYD